MSELVNLAVLLGIPANVAAIIAAFWLIDRRLVRIETKISACPVHAGAVSDWFPHSPRREHRL